MPAVHVVRTALLAAAVAACGRSPAEAPPQAPRPPGLPTALRVSSAGVEGEYPVPDDDPSPNLTLHLVDGDPAAGWHPDGVARLEVAEAELVRVEILQEGVSSLRWRPLHADGEGLRAGPWKEVDLSRVAAVGGGPWRRFNAGVEQIRGIELEVPSSGPSTSIGEIRLVGHAAAPDEGVRSTRWVALTSSTPDGPFPLAAEQVEALDPPRCTVRIGGVEHRVTEEGCAVDGDEVTLQVEGAGGAVQARQFRVRPISSCVALIDGHPYTRCGPPVVTR